MVSFLRPVHHGNGLEQAGATGGHAIPPPLPSAMPSFLYRTSSIELHARRAFST
jgi:hypothetical protein